MKLAPSSIPGEQIGVYTIDWIKEGTEIGPFVGRILQKHQIDFSNHNQHLWEVFSASDGQVLHFIDASEAAFQCWMNCIQCARNDDEQNLDRIQIGNEIYYKARKVSEEGIGISESRRNRRPGAWTLSGGGWGRRELNIISSPPWNVFGFFFGQTIPPDHELLVWYSASQPTYLGIPDTDATGLLTDISCRINLPTHLKGSSP